MWWIFELAFLALIMPFVMIGGAIGGVISLFDMRLFIPAALTGIVGLNLCPFSQPRENAEVVSVIEVIAQTQVFHTSLPVLLIVASITLMFLSGLFKTLKPQ